MIKRNQIIKKWLKPIHSLSILIKWSQSFENRITSTGGSVVECSPATRAARVRPVHFLLKWTKYYSITKIGYFNKKTLTGNRTLYEQSTNDSPFLVVLKWMTKEKLQNLFFPIFSENGWLNIICGKGNFQNITLLFKITWYVKWWTFKMLQSIENFVLLEAVQV